MNTIQYLPETVRYMQQVFPWVHTRVLDANGILILHPFLQRSLGFRPTDRPTDQVLGR